MSRTEARRGRFGIKQLVILFLILLPSLLLAVSITQSGGYQMVCLGVIALGMMIAITNP